MVLQDPLSNRCVYYQDKGKRYRFVTDATEGMPLLCDLVTTNRDLLARNEAIMGLDAAVRGCPSPLIIDDPHRRPLTPSQVS